MSTTVKRKPPLAPAPSSFHRLRKRVHLLCFLAFLALPFCNLVRFDIPRQRFYFAGYELWINEFGIVFFALMFLMFVVVASSVFFGRVYCGYVCPQMIFSEASMVLERRMKRRLPPRAAQAAFYAVTGIASIFLAFAFISYFVAPRDLLHRLLALDVRTAGGISGAVVTAIAFLDFALVRQRFCTTVCPYGYLQGILGDDHTLLVTYGDEKRECIECKKCVRVCHMGIDIRKSPYQIECVHCGECIDACEDVLRRIGTPGLIHYTWGERNTRFWDGKRFVVLAVLLFYASGLFVALSMRRTVLVRVAPVRSVLYTIGPDGSVRNQFRFTLANRGRGQQAVVFTIQQLPGATLVLPQNPVPVPAGETVRGEFLISAPPAGRLNEVNHFTIVTTAIPEQVNDSIPMTFLMPPGRSHE
jgi:cytochrome c oxidase accessory protein FixG